MSEEIVSQLNSLFVKDEINDVEYASLIDNLIQYNDPRTKEYQIFIKSNFLKLIKPYDIDEFISNSDYITSATKGASLLLDNQENESSKFSTIPLKREILVSDEIPVIKKKQITIDDSVPNPPQPKRIQTKNETGFQTAAERLYQDEIRKGNNPQKPKKKFQPPYKKDNIQENKEKQTKINKQKKGDETEDWIEDVNGVPLDDPRLINNDPSLLTKIVHEILDKSPKVTWDEIAGLKNAKKIVQEAVIWPMLRPDIFTGLRAPPKGLLLFGPPGTGKTMIGKAIASQSNATFFNISASALTSKWIGEGEKLVRALFAVASCYERSVIFIDEIDSLLSARSESEHESSRRLKTEFLVRLDGAGTDDERILVVGATNRPQEIDEAARRRLVKRLYIPLPDIEARMTLVKTLLNKVKNEVSEEEINIIGEKTDGYSGSDMKELVKDAAYGPIRELNSLQMNIIDVDTSQVRPVQLKDFIDSLRTIRPSVSQDDLVEYIDWNNKYGSVSS
ncbi:hypothetical protein ENUP19_0240G0005 [Entamoeba nuttalli]|uniref:ATPase, Vps4 oligomerisation domain containing protein n=2 Tax=Entamoeba nuttalli TaxID=412467 RepID=K2GCS4_ENTNP|nr:ATPase, Vps4 oligomerisation domain containing protein [Entamoeba nuttalli P19]EKE40356.1 ATPase, Vps4 oligomerisation domain containing protein [Entamoeba nuttalli P19]|eukprot:XP_008857305.1 ATPase, Vps4 oligomerisation domain containing protein [Entamoeba nuttalli P19]